MDSSEHSQRRKRYGARTRRTKKWTTRTRCSGSLFAAAPRGHKRFTYRLAEVQASRSAQRRLGPAAPSPKLFDWKECAVIAPESKANCARL
jgi:hypothetical protein